MTLSLDARGAGPREPRALRLIEEAATLGDPGWLPGGTGWVGLDDLAADHRRLLAGRASLAEERAGLLGRFKAEDRAHNEALRDGFRRGEDAAMPEVTPAEERRAALTSVEERHRAANDALDGFLAEAVALIEEEAGGWLDALSERREAAAEARREAARLLAEAEAEEMQLRVLRGWVERNAALDARPSFRSTPMRFYPWARMKDEYRPPEPRLADPSKPLLSQLEVVDTHNPEQFLTDINRGVVAPLRPRTSEED